MSPKVFTCQNCGKNFTNPKNAYRNPKFCCLECSYQFGQSTKKCPVCGKVVTRQKHRKRVYCSKECYYQTRRETRICKYCQQPFTVTKSSKKIYCCRECSSNGQTDNRKKQLFICQWCHKEFEEWSYRQPTFCSNQCRSEYAAHQPKPTTRRPENFITQDCLICGKSYTVHKSQIELRNSKYCSIECSSMAASDRMKGEGNPNYIDGSSPQDYGENWHRQSRKARKRDKNTCQHCGLKHNWEKGWIVDVHHKIPFRLFNGDYKKANRLNNLTCLCRKCHRKADSKFKEVLVMDL